MNRETVASFLRPTRTIESAGFVVAEEIHFSNAGPPVLLIELPHGATEPADLSRAKSRLAGPLPDDLADFFFVNTDFGAPELAFATAENLPDLSTILLRARLPRVLADVNRVLAPDPAAGMTPGIPSFVENPRDRETLSEWHSRYVDAASRLYDLACSSGGLALALHTYAPRSIAVDIDHEGIAGLRRAYEAQRYEQWPLRPEVDLLTATPEGDYLAHPGLATSVRAELGSLGYQIGENASYALHPATWGARFATRYRGRTLALEVRRDLLGEPWQPFSPSTVAEAAIARTGQALARAVRIALETPSIRG